MTSIGGGAFSGCSGLTSVISEITEPFNCGTDAFPTNACRNGTLYVPAGTKDLYIRFDGWRNFLHIEEGGETAKYKLSFVVNNKELSTKNVEVGATIAPPTTDGEGNTVTGYTYPATMPAHDLVVYGMVVKQPEPEVLVWLTVKDGQINLLQAIAQMGDLQGRAKVQKVRVIREDDGKRMEFDVDLTTKALYDSPAFYLQQNDMVYAEPRKRKSEAETKTFTYVSLMAALASIAYSTAYILK